MGHLHINRGRNRPGRRMACFEHSWRTTKLRRTFSAAPDSKLTWAERFAWKHQHGTPCARNTKRHRNRLRDSRQRNTLQVRPLRSSIDRNDSSQKSELRSFRGTKRRAHWNLSVLFSTKRGALTAPEGRSSE